MSSIAKKESRWDQLMVLRGLSKHAGILHEAQIVQLKYWPRVIFPHSNYSEFTYDPDNQLIEFRLRLRRIGVPKDMAARLKNFDKAVKQLIGENFRVRVKTEKKILMDIPGVNLQEQDVGAGKRAGNETG